MANSHRLRGVGQTGAARRQYGHHDTPNHHNRAGSSSRWWRLVRPGTLVLTDQAVASVGTLVSAAQPSANGERPAGRQRCLAEHLGIMSSSMLGSTRRTWMRPQVRAKNVRRALVRRFSVPAADEQCRTLRRRPFENLQGKKPRPQFRFQDCPVWLLCPWLRKRLGFSPQESGQMQPAAEHGRR
jgi:hypothetical protein